MNKFFLFFPTCCLLLSCSNFSVHDETDEQNKKENKSVTKRDLSITPANSYSKLFMDSAVVEAFITEQKVVDSLARRLLRFYNAGIYQFAWFSDDGLKEQARGFWNLHEYVQSYDGDTSLNHSGLKKAMDRLIAE